MAFSETLEITQENFEIVESLIYHYGCNIALVFLT